MMMMIMNEDEEYMYSEAIESEQLGLSRNKKIANKKRFSEEQIKSLEKIFESESKLESRKKLQVARELGLQPRQVAIWFQNRRARYKSKQLEQDYGVLRGNYSSLASRFETLKKEKQNLQEQVQQLNNQMKKSGEAGRDEAKGESELKPRINLRLDDDRDMKSKSPSLERSEHNIVLSDEDTNIKAKYLEEPELPSMVRPAESTRASPENWGNFEVEGFINQSGSSYCWWDIWS